MPKKVLQIPVDETHVQWIGKSMKEMKIKKQPEFFRTILSYLMESDTTELKNKIEKARIDSMLQEVTAEVEEKTRLKEQLVKQRERLEVE